MFICPECGERYEAAGSCGHDGTALTQTTDELMGQSIGSWRITKLLGEGGMGRVYKAVQPSIGSRVAIKVITGQPTPDLVDRFFAEARAVNLIRHEQIVNVLALDRLPDGKPYIVMEYLDGAPLSAVLARGQMPLGSLVQLATEVLDALSAAHARSIVHRDLKPDNIWVTAAGRAKVLDFGIAKLDPGVGGHQATRTGSILGTPTFMSPEQAQGRPIDARSDLYAMGVILYAATTGKVPFAAEALFELLRMHIMEAPVPPRTLRPDLTPELEAVILRAMEKDPANRYADAAEMSAALSAAGQTLPADSWVSLRSSSGSPAGTSGLRTPPRPSRPPTTAGRRRWPLFAGIAVAVLGGFAALVAMGGDDKAPEPAPAKPVAVVAVDAAPRPAAVAVAPAPPVMPDAAPPVVPDAAPPAKPELTPAAILDATRFDGIGYMREAQRLAKLVAPDAELIDMYVPNVQPDGTADLTLDETSTATYCFRSPSAAATAPCLIDISATAKGVKIDQKRGENNCEEPIVGLPTCTLSEIWNDAINAKLPLDVLAGVAWTIDDKGRARWQFTSDKKVKWFQDGCVH